MENVNESNISVDNDVSEKIGTLNEATKQLEESIDEDCELDAEETGKWVTAIGKALLAIFKP